MKLLRVGTKGNERPAILDKNGKIRDLSSLGRLLKFRVSIVYFLLILYTRLVFK